MLNKSMVQDIPWFWAHGLAQFWYRRRTKTCLEIINCINCDCSSCYCAGTKLHVIALCIQFLQLKCNTKLHFNFISSLLYLFSDIACNLVISNIQTRLKGIVHQKWKFCHNFCHNPQIVPYLYECLCSGDLLCLQNMLHDLFTFTQCMHISIIVTCIVHLD